MTSGDNNKTELETLATLVAEVGRIHQELSLLHRETLAALRCLSSVIAELREVKALESAVDHRLGDLAARIDKATPPAPADHTRCKACGAPLETHHAPAGDLLCCRNCGWSEFLTLDGRASEEVQPATVPQTAPAATWVA